MTYSGWTYHSENSIVNADADSETRVLCTNTQHAKCKKLGKCIGESSRYSKGYFKSCRELEIVVREMM